MFRAFGNYHTVGLFWTPTEPIKSLSDVVMTYAKNKLRIIRAGRELVDVPKHTEVGGDKRASEGIES